RLEIQRRQVDQLVQFAVSKTIKIQFQVRRTRAPGTERVNGRDLVAAHAKITDEHVDLFIQVRAPGGGFETVRRRRLGENGPGSTSMAIGGRAPREKLAPLGGNRLRVAPIIFIQ